MIECIKFKSYQKGTLQGYAEIYVPKWGIELSGFSLHMKDGRRWINFPSKEYKNEKGETKYIAQIRFRQKGLYENFCEQVKEAIDKWCLENT